jgi:ABC-type sugar transport system ATPase subunit
MRWGIDGACRRCGLPIQHPEKTQVAEEQVVLAVERVSKAFGGSAALRDVDLTVRAGEVHALIGMNGAGKSTLVGVLSGAHTPDSGDIFLDGEQLHALTPRRAREHGISTVPQKRDLVMQLTVAENLFLGALPRRAGVIDWPEVHRKARAALDLAGLRMDTRTLAGELTVAEQTMVEIAREVHRGGRVLILDEPTASLGGAAAESVRDLVRRLRSQGTAVVYISHHLDEILELADRVTVLRDGRNRLTVERADCDLDGLVTAMVGGSVDTKKIARTRTFGEERLRVEDLRVGNRVEGLSFGVRAGEVVAVLGTAGDAQAELFGVLSGALRPDDGMLTIGGKLIRWGSVRASLASGLRCITGDRNARGLVSGLTIDENITMARDRLARTAFVSWRSMSEAAGSLRRRFGVTTIQRNPPVGMLSGGNQQKVLLAKWLESDPEVVFLEDPTNGVDIAAKADIHRLIDGLAERGSAVLLASSDVHEVLRLADRIIIVSAGRFVAERTADSATVDELAVLTLGQAAPTIA